jgi:hypothetical protein
MRTLSKGPARHTACYLSAGELRSDGANTNGGEALVGSTCCLWSFAAVPHHSSCAQLRFP